MIEGVTRQFDVDPLKLGPEEIAEAARLYMNGIRRVYDHFSPDRPDVDSVSVDALLTDGTEVGFNVARVGLVMAYTPDQLHSYGPNDVDAITRNDSASYDTMGRNTPERERIRPADSSLQARLARLKAQAAEERAVGMTGLVDPDEVGKLFALILQGKRSHDVTLGDEGHL